MIRFIIAPGLSAPSDSTVRPDGSISVPTASTASSLAFISRPPIDIRSLSVTRTLTIASCHFCTSPRAAARESACCAPTPGDAANTSRTAAGAARRPIDPPGGASIGPRRLHLHEERPDAAADGQHDRRRLRRGNLRHLPLHRRYVRYLFAVDRKNEIPLRQMPERRPAAFGDGFDQYPLLVAPAGSLAIDGRHVAHPELEGVVVVLLHLPRQARRGGELHLELPFLLVAEDRQLHVGANLVLPDRRRQQVFFRRLRRVQRLAIDRRDDVADFEAGVGPLREELRHAEPFASLHAEEIRELRRQ